MTSDVKRYDILATVAVTTLARVASMMLGLAAMYVTFLLLSAPDFALFNFLLFLVAMGSALNYPINRYFWARGRASYQAVCGWGGLAVAAPLVIIGFCVALLVGEVAPMSAFALALLAGLYGASRHFERYGYAANMLQVKTVWAALALSIFAFSEFIAAVMLWTTANNSLELRIGMPIALFAAVATLLAMSRAPLQLIKAPPPWRLSKRLMCSQLFNGVGVRFIALHIVATSATMSERAMASFVDVEQVAFVAPYLLGLSYAVAFQSLLLILFDVARTRVYQQSRWLSGARRNAIGLLVALAGALACGILAYPILRAVTLLPDMLSFPAWCGLVVRAVSISALYVLLVDKIQDGRSRQMLMASLAILILSVVAFIIAVQAASDEAIGWILGFGSLLIVAIFAVGFFKRLPQS